MNYLRSAILLAIVGAAVSTMGCSSTNGSVDASRLSSPCTSGTCANGGTCTNFSAVDTTYDLPFCVNTQNACDVVKCDKGSCTLTRGTPNFVHCSD